MAVRRIPLSVPAMTLWLIANFSPTLTAQFTSAVEGTVTDPSGAVVPNASLTIQNAATGIKATAPTSASGYFRFPALPASTFRLTATASGFKTTQVNDLRLQVGETRTVDLALEVGAAATAVTVEATAAAVELSVARVSSVVDQKQLTDLPLQGRNFLGLVALTPGVTGSTGQNDVFGSEPQIAMNAAGLRGEQNGFAVDSGTVTSMVRHGRINMQPNAESIQEMRVAVNNFSAEQGNDAGASVNVLTRSGTNRYHGSLGFFHTDNALQSRTIFQNTRNALTGRILPVSRRNEAVGSIGGPVIKNRTFLFGSFDVLRQVTAAGGTSTVETPEFRSWVKSVAPNKLSAFLLDKYPAAFAPYSNLRTAGSILGVNCGSNPSANIATAAGPIPCNLPVMGEGITPITSPREGEQWNLRGDHMIGSKDRFYASVFRNGEGSMDGSTIRPAFRVYFPIRNWFGNINETHTFSPNLINEFRATVVRVHGDIRCAECNIPDSIGITSGFTGFGKGGPVPFIQNNYEYRDNLSWIHNSHTVRLGAQFSKLQSNWKPTASYQRPQFTFNNIWDFVNDDPFSQSNVGLNPKDGSVYTPDVAERQTTLSWFAEDSWKARRNLTITYGLRWETYGKVNQATLGNNVEWRGGADFTSRIAQGANVTKQHILDRADLNNFAPRLSLAWDPTGRGKLSVRAGTGIFYDFLPSQLYGGAHFTPPIYMIITASKQTAPLLPRYEFGKSTTDPYQFPRPYGLEGIIGLDSRNGSTYARSNIVWVDPNLRSSYTSSYFAGVQYALTETMTMEANYVGNTGHKLYSKYNVNRFNGDLIQNNNTLKRLNPSFGNISYGQSNLGSYYNGGNISIRERSRHGLMFQAAYTFGRTLDYGSSFDGLTVTDVYNLKLNHALADFDVSQKLATSLVWEIPGPKAGLMKGVLGGWQLSETTVLQGGSPFSVNCTMAFTPVRNSAGQITGNSGCDYNADGNNNDRPHPASNNAIDYSRDALLAGVFTRADFPVPGLGETGSLGRNTYRNRGLANTDITMMKIGRLKWLGEAGQMQFRVDAFNAFNRVNLGGISSSLNSTTFGRVTGSGAARRFQFGMRLSF